MIDTFTVCSFNCWAMHFSNPKRRDRISLLAYYMASEDCKFDILSLQELWRTDDFEFMTSIVKFRFPYFYQLKRFLLLLNAVELQVLIWLFFHAGP